MLQPENPLVGADPDAADIGRARRATLPRDELEAEAARQGCSPADIFFDRAGLGGPSPSSSRRRWADDDDADEAQYVPWRGLDPRPRA